jgi:HEAT repeat protein
MVARNAAHALVAIGEAAVPALVAGLKSAGPRMRKYCVFALGEIASNDPAAIAALVAGCGDADVYVRINSVEALGLKLATPDGVAALARALTDSDDEVRFNAALALARIGKGAEAAVPALADALNDGNRYVGGYAIEALDRIGTPEAYAVLVPHLKVARWCPITNNKSLF